MSNSTVDSTLTAKIYDFAFSELRTDLVGIANIERYKNAPPMMSPQGILPTAKSVIVMAIRHPDGCIEMGGITHPQDIGPYAVQYYMNSRLDEMSYRMGVLLEKNGFQAVSIASSNIWRYKGYKDLTENFAPDVSHRHGAVASGIAEFGYSGLAITPEYGARQRYVTVITDAVLQPSPLLEPGSVCDRCDLCVKYCMSSALSKELDGLSVVKIEDKEYTYANKNLWRCAWGEHFDLDLDLPIPEHVNEEVILKAVEKHGVRGGEMGSCLRYCLPKALRTFEPDYTNAPRRKREHKDTPARMLKNKLSAIASKRGADFVMISDSEELQRMGIDPKKYLPNGSTAVVFGLHYAPVLSEATGFARDNILNQSTYDAARMLEDCGHDAVSQVDFPRDIYKKHIEGVETGREIMLCALITSADISSTPKLIPKPARKIKQGKELTKELRTMLDELGADLVGVSPAERLEALHPKLSEIFGGQEHFVAFDKAGRKPRYEPEISVEKTRAIAPSEHMKGAKSVMVIGLRMPSGNVTRTTKPPAEAVGPYVFAQYASAWLLSTMAFRAARLIEDAGFTAKVSHDLSNLGAVAANPRGEQPTVFSNRFEAVAAGLGHIGKGGFVITPEFGTSVRFVAVLTDAELVPNEVSSDMGVLSECEGCSKCLSSCRTDAFSEEMSLDIGGVIEKFHIIDRKRCDWALRYSLVPEEGPTFTGWDTNVELPDEITMEKLDAGLRQHPGVSKARPCNFEACVLACPITHQV